MCHSGARPRNPGNGAYKDVPAGQWPPDLRRGDDAFLGLVS